MIQDSASCCVLLVENEARIAMLEDLGYEVVTVATRRNAIETESAASQRRFASQLCKAAARLARIKPAHVKPTSSTSLWVRKVSSRTASWVEW
jgi:hypothetical protein